MAGMVGIEPTMTGSKPVALTAWRHPSNATRTTCYLFTKYYLLPNLLFPQYVKKT
jgi:hypothetical protein